MNLINVPNNNSIKRFRFSYQNSMLNQIQKFNKKINKDEKDFTETVFKFIYLYNQNYFPIYLFCLTEAPKRFSEVTLINTELHESYTQLKEFVNPKLILWREIYKSIFDKTEDKFNASLLIYRYLRSKANVKYKSLM